MKVKRIRKEIFIALLLVIVFLFTYITTKKDIFVTKNIFFSNNLVPLHYRDTLLIFHNSCTNNLTLKSQKNLYQ